MHSLVVCLFQEQMEKATVTFHSTQTAKVTSDGCDHSWNSGNSFQENYSIENLILGENFVVAPASGSVEDSANNLDGLKSRSIGKRFRFLVCELDIQVFGRVRCVRLSVDVFCRTISVQDRVPSITICVTGGNPIQCTNELGDRHAGSGLSGIKEFREFHDLFVSKCGLVTLEKIGQIVGIDSETTKFAGVSSLFLPCTILTLEVGWAYRPSESLSTSRRSCSIFRTVTSSSFFN